MNTAQAIDSFAVLRHFEELRAPWHVRRYRVTRRNVYEAIQRMEGCKIASIQSATEHKRRSLHAILQDFIREGLVRRDGHRYYTTTAPVIVNESTEPD